MITGYINNNSEMPEHLFLTKEIPCFTIICLIPRTTETSLSHAPKMHPLCVNPGVPFERVRKHTSCTCDDKRLCLEYVLTSQSFSG